MGLVSKQGDDEDEDDVGEVRITGFGPLDEEGPDEVLIDLGTWGTAARQALDERLHLLEAPHAWEGTELVVPEDSAAWVERIVEQVEDERSLELDEEGDHIAYDLTDWDPAHRAALEARLRDDLIPFSIADDELVVLEIDEQRTDEAIDAIVEPDGTPATTAEAPTEIMGQVFVAADLLAHDPDDLDGRLGIAQGALVAATTSPPYGMDRVWWEALADRLDALGRLLDAGTATEHAETAIARSAAELRDQLRPYV